jgi:hypothetical protein
MRSPLAGIEQPEPEGESGNEHEEERLGQPLGLAVRDAYASKSSSGARRASRDESADESALACDRAARRHEGPARNPDRWRPNVERKRSMAPDKLQTGLGSHSG